MPGRVHVQRSAHSLHVLRGALSSRRAPLCGDNRRYDRTRERLCRLDHHCAYALDPATSGLPRCPLLASALLTPSGRWIDQPPQVMLVYHINTLSAVNMYGGLMHEERRALPGVKVFDYDMDATAPEMQRQITDSLVKKTVSYDSEWQMLSDYTRLPGESGSVQENVEK